MIAIRNRYTDEVLLQVDADTLSGANLGEADLSEANLGEADLSEADLSGADLSGASGNGREIRSMQWDTWPVVMAGDIVAIGCRQHPLPDWWAFTDAQIASMDRRALDWWRRWKPILRQIFGGGDAAMQEADAAVQEADAAVQEADAAVREADAAVREADAAVQEAAIVVQEVGE